ncbi:MAG: prepilin-type N-terminal cleavage/methylation domain-containing protein [Candidatus Aureabacteria bacterium]|nr:prepilin-type N-terminal cleavage/methylation domain-containing protein [Candidatus Auribacterota bacterium]
MKTNKPFIKGMTLIEIVLVVLIVSIIALIAIPKLIDLRTKAEEEAEDYTIATVNRAIVTYNASYNQ